MGYCLRCLISAYPYVVENPDQDLVDESFRGFLFDLDTEFSDSAASSTNPVAAPKILPLTSKAAPQSCPSAGAAVNYLVSVPKSNNRPSLAASHPSAAGSIPPTTRRALVSVALVSPSWKALSSEISHDIRNSTGDRRARVKEFVAAVQRVRVLINSGHSDRLHRSLDQLERNLFTEAASRGSSQARRQRSRTPTQRLGQGL